MAKTRTNRRRPTFRNRLALQAFRNHAKRLSGSFCPRCLGPPSWQPAAKTATSFHAPTYKLPRPKMSVSKMTKRPPLLFVRMIFIRKRPSPDFISITRDRPSDLSLEVCIGLHKPRQVTARDAQQIVQHQHLPV